MLQWLRQWLFFIPKRKRAWAVGWVRYNPNASTVDDKSIRVLGMLVIEGSE
ncbi:MAG: hypothetical protein JNL09_02635 [Anaerolineales bacterium]|nr:hypothetical protein [Anaerolineales bacterium]